VPARNTKAARGLDQAAENRHRGLHTVWRHPLFEPLGYEADAIADKERSRCPPDGWAVVDSLGKIHLHPTRRGEPEEWAWVAAHCLLHLGFDHLAERHLAGWTAAAGAPPGSSGFDVPWNLAACLTVNRFLAHLKIGRPPAGLENANAGTGGSSGDLEWAGLPAPPKGVAKATWQKPPAWTDLFAAGLAQAVGAAVDVAGGVVESLAGKRPRKTRWRLALDWFVSSYPLLGALADAFKLVEDPKVCRAHNIRIAAISPAAAELYVNPACDLEDGEYRFVIAHELLHAGLRHDTRAGGRDPWLWNVACDYVINGWLAEMAVGDMPGVALHDRALSGMSAEQVYDIIAADRRPRKRSTLRGYDLPDILPQPLAHDPVSCFDLDDFYRRCMCDGIGYHQGQGRGLLPAALIEEIRALAQPPVPWDVQLARWFDDHFAPLERRRTYARASRRQAATPDIARPGWYLPPEAVESRTFGVVLDTSGSMDVRLLGKALGAIASFAVSREVHRVRVVFCDAEAHDNGWMPPLDIAGRVRVRGRGGTVLQPGVDLLEAAADFPKDGPILVITDGWIDRVRIKREHAFLIPAGESLPFRPHGEVFRFS
jgi:predicted metal-dependent peptidase